MPEVRVVVAVGKGIPLNDLAAGRLEIQFIAVNNPDAVVAENVSIAGDPDQDQKRQSFMAGYLAAVVSEDYKVAAMVPANDVSGSLASDSFVTGARFYCGLCKPKYPPYGSFPQWESFPAGSEMSVWRPLVDAFSNAGVEVMYLQSQIMSVELLTYLAETGIKVIGDSSPDMDRNFWVGTIALDPEQTLVEIWQSALDGEGDIQKPFSIALLDQKAGLVSEGRARLFKEMLEDLEAGEVLPESSP